MRPPRRPWPSLLALWTSAVWTVLAVQAESVPAAAVPAADSRIVEVTVYRDRAEIVREARLLLPAGSSTVEFTGLPIGVEPDSLRVRAEGVPALLGAVEIVEVAEEPEEDAELVTAREEVERIERSLAALDHAARVDQQLATFLTSLQAAVAQDASRDLGQGSVDTASIGALYDLLAARLGRLAERELERTDQRGDLHEALELARARLQTLQPSPGIHSRIAAVDVETRQAGALTLRLAYVVPGAFWRPAYRASLDASSGALDLVSEGVVRQSTGEDWRGVTLRLSSAAPAQGLEPPFLPPWLLRPIEPVGAFGKRTMGEPEVPPRFYQNTLDMAPGVAAPPAAPAEVAEASLVRSAYSVLFEVPGSSDVPADGRDHRVALRSETLAGKLVHRIVPELEPRAYLTTVVTTPADYPLLAGPMRVFTDGAYVGSFPLTEQGPGVELTVPAGVDNRLEVVRVQLPRSAERQGLAGGRTETEYAFRTEIRNLQDRPATVVLEERVPVSEDERIVVELDDRRTTPGFDDSPRRPGVKLWNLELEPGGKREIVLVYSVKHPRDLLVPGLP